MKWELAHTQWTKRGQVRQKQQQQQRSYTSFLPFFETCRKVTATSADDANAYERVCFRVANDSWRLTKALPRFVAAATPTAVLVAIRSIVRAAPLALPAE